MSIKQEINVTFEEPASEQIKLGEIPANTYFKFSDKEENQNFLFIKLDWPKEWDYGNKIDRILCISLDKGRITIFEANDLVEIPKKVQITHF